MSAKLLLWKPRHGHRNPGRPKFDYATLLTEDTGLNLDELSNAMSNSGVQLQRVRVRPIDDDDDDDV